MYTSPAEMKSPSFWLLMSQLQRTAILPGDPVRVSEGRGLKSQTLEGSFTSHPLDRGLSNTKQLVHWTHFQQYFRLLPLLFLDKSPAGKSPEAPLPQSWQPLPRPWQWLQTSGESKFVYRGGGASLPCWGGGRRSLGWAKATRRNWTQGSQWHLRRQGLRGAGKLVVLKWVCMGHLKGRGRWGLLEP